MGAAMENNADVIIVGAGPAGLAAAEVSARAGLKTAVYEKNEAIGIPVRTSGGSWIEDLRKLGIPEEYYHPVYQLRVQTGSDSACYAYPKALACVIDVRRLYQYLGEQAIAAGAVIHLKTSIENPLLSEGKVIGVAIRAGKNGSENQVRAKIVVDASGYAGLLGKKAGINAGYRSFGFGAEYDLFALNFDEDEAVLFLGAATAPNGYGWAFPYGRHRVRLGVGVIRPYTDNDPREYLDNLLYNNPYLNDKLKGSSPIEVHTGLFPIYPPAGHRFVADGLITVGDAAGQGSSLLGEGIRYAIASGRMAGETIVASFKASDQSAAFLKSYERKWKARFFWNLKIAFWIHQRIALFNDQDWDRLMPVLRTLTPDQIAQGLNGNFSLAWALGIVSKNPGIITKIIKRSVKS